MATNARRPRFRHIDNTGFGVNSSAEGSRLTNKDGSVNLRKTGMHFWEKISLYHTLLRMPRWKFFAVIFLFYTTVNFFFACIYFSLGAHSLEGIEIKDGMMNHFVTAFFFSSQTLTTVGYGHISPMGFWANVVASLESFMGILSFALVTGLLYGRFTRPQAYLLFSEHMIIAPYKEGKALMLRMATFKNNHLTDAEATVTVALHTRVEGKRVTQFYPLTLEISKIASLALNWTLVHALNENSPLYQYTEQELREAEIELIVYIKAFDDHFANIVQQRTSYTHQELLYGARFLPMYRRAEDGTHTILELDKLDAVEKVKLYEPETLEANA